MPRQSFKDFESDAWYEAWREGRNGDEMREDRLRDAYDRGDSAAQAARDALPRRPRIEADDEQHDEACGCSYCLGVLMY